MAFISAWDMLRVLKPVLAGVALAYVVTGFLDGPPPVNFQPEDPYSAKQAEIVEPEAELVIEKNIMKLGSLLSVKAVESLPGLMDRDAQEDLEFFFTPDETGDLPAVKGTVSEPGS